MKIPFSIYESDETKDDKMIKFKQNKSKYVCMTWLVVIAFIVAAFWWSSVTSSKAIVYRIHKSTSFAAPSRYFSNANNDEDLSCFDEIIATVDGSGLGSYDVDGKHLVSLFDQNTQFTGVGKSDLVDFLTTNHDTDKLLAMLKIKEVDYDQLSLKFEFTGENSGILQECGGSNVLIMFSDEYQCAISQVVLSGSSNEDNDKLSDYCCFAADSMVYRLNDNNDDSTSVESVELRDLKVDDYVMTNKNGDFKQVLLRGHYIDNPNESKITKLNQICFNGNNNDKSNENECITATDSHLLFVNGVELDSLMPSRNVRIGDSMYNVNDPTNPQIVTSISTVYDEFRNVVTEDGMIVINDFIASCHVGESKMDHINLHSLCTNLYWFFNDVLDFGASWRDDWKVLWFRETIVHSYVNVYIPMRAMISDYNVLVSLFGCLVAVVGTRKMITTRFFV